MPKTRYLILGGGISGLTAAYLLAKNKNAQIYILEKEKSFGGLCRTITEKKHQYDLGSHRIHMDIDKSIQQIIHELCGEELLFLKRESKLVLKNHYLPYPINSAKFFLILGLLESTRCSLSLFISRINLLFKKNKLDNYESYLKAKAGNRAYELFYKPYAVKTWGCAPNMLSLSVVKKRISMLRPLDFLRYLLFSRHRKKMDNYYFGYPLQGIGTIPNNLIKVLENSNNVKLFSGVKLIRIVKNEKQVWFKKRNKNNVWRFDKIISTVPLTELIKFFPSSDQLNKIVDRFQWRHLKMVYLNLSNKPQIRGETFYFPERKFIFGRVSIPQRFSTKMGHQKNWTYVCEIPFSPGDPICKFKDQDLFRTCSEDLIKAGLITSNKNYLNCPDNFIVNLNYIYPFYIKNWERPFWLAIKKLNREYPFIYLAGRQALFLHCNLDQSMKIVEQLVNFLKLNRSVAEWNKHLNSFQNIKVKD